MRDDSHKWNAPSQSDEHVDLGVAQFRSVHLNRQQLLSGTSVFSQVEQPLVHWPDTTKSVTYALCLRRDRVLLVNASARQEGWIPDLKQAVSDANDAYAVFDLEGEGALEVLKRGAELSLNQPSKSVLRRLFGLDVMLYRYGNDHCFRIHVAAAMQEALCSHVQDAASLIPKEQRP